jgi:2-amino-4-hydroxy-6-hydroxymethyldihydropteridine diphosphokinase
MSNIFLQTGTNLGNRLENLAKANRWIEKQVGKIICLSSIYETEAWGITQQPLFLNQVLIVETELPAQEVLETILKIETRLGRIRKERWAERWIDIDILFYGEEVICTEGLEIPHPRIQERNFVLQPLAEIAADFIHPIFKKSIKELLRASEDRLNVRVFEDTKGMFILNNSYK